MTELKRKIGHFKGLLKKHGMGYAVSSSYQRINIPDITLVYVIMFGKLGTDYQQTGWVNTAAVNDGTKLGTKIRNYKRCIDALKEFEINPFIL